MVRLYVIALPRYPTNDNCKLLLHAAATMNDCILNDFTLANGPTAIVSGLPPPLYATFGVLVNTVR